MSHFTLLVIGEDVEEQLAPFVEEVDENSEYAVFEDKTEEGTEEYMSDPIHVTNYPTLELFMRNYNGYVERDGRWGYWHNPNAKWDWYIVGGRWTGFFKLKPGAEGKTGSPGLMKEPAPEGYADICFKKDIDINSMKQAAEEKANKRFDLLETTLAGRPLPRRWEEVRKEYENIDEALEVYNSDPVVVDLQKADLISFWGEVMDEFCEGNRERYVERAKQSVIVPFAILKDGKWYEMGTMGWWAMVADEKEEDKWIEEVDKLISESTDATLLTIVDCHI